MGFIILDLHYKEKSLKFQGDITQNVIKVSSAGASAISTSSSSILDHYNQRASGLTIAQSSKTEVDSSWKRLKWKQKMPIIGEDENVHLSKSLFKWFE